MSSLNVIRLAMVGCGVIATHHLKAIVALNVPRPVVTTLIDPNVKAAWAVRKLLLEQQQEPCQVREVLLVELAPSVRSSMWPLCWKCI